MLRPIASGRMEPIEQATELLLAAFGHDAWVYYLGAAPFVAAAVWVLTRLAGWAARPEQIAAWALLLTALYTVKIVTDGIFLRRLAGQQRGGPGLDRAARELAVRSLLILLWLASLPLLFLLIPVYFAAQLYPLTGRLRRATALAWNHYGSWFPPLLVGCLAALLLAVDAAAAAVIAPAIFAALTGAQGSVIRSLPFVENSTLLLAIAGGLYLLFDPWFKSVAALVYWHAEAVASGADLRTRLAALKAEVEPSPWPVGGGQA